MKTTIKIHDTKWFKKHCKVAELEKENAELRKEVKNNEDLAVVAYMHGAEKQKRKSKEQLIKARELLKWALHSDPEHDDLVDFDTKWKEAEQFLKEVE